MTAARRWGPWVVLAGVLAVVLVIGTRPSGGPRTEAQRVQHISSQLRCPVCEGQTVAESDSPVSQAIRDDIAQRVHNGESDSQILAFVVSRYPNTLLTPPSSGVGVIIWALPVLAFVAAVAGLGLGLRPMAGPPGCRGNRRRPGAGGRGAATVTIIGSKSADGRAPGTPALGPPAVDADVETAARTEERDFLLTSLADLDAERDAGDIDDADYQALRDDYTRRAAAVLRALKPGRTGSGGAGPAVEAATAGDEAAPGRSGRSGRSGRRRWRTAAVVLAIAVVGLGAAWAVTASSGSRLPSQPITGTFAGPNAPGGTQAPSAGVDSRLLQAGQLVTQGKVTDALKLYDQVLKDRPNDPEALANEGWLIAQAGVAASQPALVDQGLSKIQAAELSDPTYPSAHFFRGYLLFRVKGDAAGAVTELRQYLGMVDPSSPEVPQVEQVLQAAVAAAGSKVPPGPNAPSG